MYREIEKLIEKYFEGNTTLQEEQELKRFFSEEEVPAHFQRYLPYFSFLEREQEECMSEDIGHLSLPGKKSGKYRFLFTWGIAAGFLVLIATALFLDRERSRPGEKEVRKAYQEAQTALSYAGFWLDKGVDDTRTLKYLPESMEDMSKVSYYTKSAEETKKLKSFGVGVRNMTKVSQFMNYQPINN